MSEETRQRIIEAGADLVHQKGFNNTGLKDILRAADVPKGSFYFYFANKEAFGIAIVDHFSKGFRDMTDAIRRDTSLTPLEKVRAIFHALGKHFKDHGYTRGCPLGNLAQEMSDLSEPFRASLSSALDGMAGIFAELVAEAQAAGEVSTDLDPHDTGIFIVESSHGALIRMKVSKSDEPLEINEKFIFGKILK
ncbi:TetR family transcriptional regulator [Pseudodesulfovibrio cashew]|uniref:TetR family transcriptional regulator n=1 Tax=Pseudodesulfovibrio cashew TaxID=2678688 RepID=A0A6I6JKK9_9BACT|nr:TetR/AcrR family transcriptional regulator [Pseudodesulfovibrio cashew]QGY40842.1 TetR family transcriptional regulator [Pseudodesulfovibrio cashew]